MKKGTRAQKVKRALREITLKLQANGGTSSKEVVSMLKAKFQDDLKHDLEDVVDVGLTVLAGRVGLGPTYDPNQTDMFGFREITNLKLEQDGKIVSRRFATDAITPKLWLSQKKKAPRKNSATRSSDKVDAIVAKMVAEGLSDMTIGQYKAI